MSLVLGRGKMYAQCPTVSRCITNLVAPCAATVRVYVCWSYCGTTDCACNGLINPGCVSCSTACTSLTISAGSTSCVTIPAGADPSCSYQVTLLEPDGITPELEATFPYMLGEDLNSPETKRGHVEFIVNDDGSITIKACN